MAPDGIHPVDHNPQPASDNCMQGSLLRRPPFGLFTESAQTGRARSGLCG